MRCLIFKIHTVFSCLVWKPLCLSKPDYKRRTYGFLSDAPHPPRAPSVGVTIKISPSPRCSALPQILGVNMHLNETLRYRETSPRTGNFAYLMPADICIFMAPPAARLAGEHRVSFSFIWSNESIVNQHEVCCY